MKSKLQITLLLLTCCSLYTMYPQLKEEKAPLTPCVLTDLGGVNLRPSKKVMTWQMGLYPIVRYLTAGYSTQDLQSRLFEFLNLIPIDRPEEGAGTVPCDSHNNPVPPIMHAWLAGTIKTAHARALIIHALHEHRSVFKNRVERTLISNICNTIFTPQLFAHSMKLVPGRWSLIKALKKAGCRIIILSNWDKESFQHMKKKYPQLEAVADEIVISGEINYVKPDPQIFDYVLEKYGLTPTQCVLLDDQDENLSAAQALGIHTINGSLARSTADLHQDFQTWINTLQTSAEIETPDTSLLTTALSGAYQQLMGAYSAIVGHTSAC